VDPELSAFVLGGVSIAVGTRDADCRPHLTRAIGCSFDGRRLTLFVVGAQSQAVLEDVASNRLVAAVFTRPSTHRTVQLKGGDAAIVPVHPEDVERIAAYGSAFVAELESIGYPRHFTEALLGLGDGEIVGIAFTPGAAFSGTPGPRAGEPLEAPT
jgi:hypothetical protein